jgi:hypothetical protein
MVAEISGDRMVFNAVNQLGAIVDSGVVVRQELSSAAVPSGEPRP